MPAEPESRVFKHFLIISLAIGYLAIYLALYRTIGIPIVVLVSIPAAAAAWLYGLRIGLIAAILGVLLNLILIGITGNTLIPSVRSVLMLGTLVLFFFTISVGLLRELRQRLSRELSGREIAESAMRQRNAELEAVYHANLQLTSSLELEPVLETVLDQVSALLNALDVNIFLFDGEKLSFGAALVEGKRQDNPYREPRPEGLTYTVARTGQRMVISDTRNHYLFKNDPWDGAIAGFPLSIGERIYGVMNVGFSAAHGFTDSELRILELLAAQAAVAIRNARDYEMARQHAEELEQHVAARTAELSRAKESAEALLNNSFDVILLLNADGIIQQTNPAFERTFGIAEGEGRAFPTLFQDTALLDRQLQTVVTEHTIHHIEAIAQRAGGTFMADLVFVPLDSPGSNVEIICNLRDITEQKRAEERQHTLTLGLRKVLTLTYELISSPDIDALWKRAVEMAREVLDVERCSIFIERDNFMHGTYGTSLQRETTDEHLSSYFKAKPSWERLEHVLALDVPAWEVEYQPRTEWDGGKVVHLSPGWIAITPIHSAYRFIGVFYNDTAISGAPLDEIQQEIIAMYCSFLGSLYEHKRVEDEIRRALERERELGELKTRFTSMISHELRTPLASIQLASDLLKNYNDRLSDEARMQHLDKIQGQVRHLTNLLEDVLTYTKAEQTGLMLQREHVDLRAFCAGVCAEVASTHPTHQVVCLDAPGEWKAAVDTKLLRQAVMNLLLNAVKFSEDGTSVTLALERDGKDAVIRVTDEGVGIPEADQPHIFDIFYRAKNVGMVPGTGLGLALVHQIARAHDGFVFCESRPRGGSTFTLRLPVFV